MQLISRKALSLFSLALLHGDFFPLLLRRPSGRELNHSFLPGKKSLSRLESLLSSLWARQLREAHASKLLQG